MVCSKFSIQISHVKKTDSKFKVYWALGMGIVMDVREKLLRSESTS